MTVEYECIVCDLRLLRTANKKNLEIPHTMKTILYHLLHWYRLTNIIANMTTVLTSYLTWVVKLYKTMDLRLVQFMYAEKLNFLARSESEFQNHEDIYDLFYTCFACLSAHFISMNANNCKYIWFIIGSLFISIRIIIINLENNLRGSTMTLIGKKCFNPLR